MKPPKVLALASATDLDFRYGCTPAWWQIWKGLYAAGVDLIVTPYRGKAIESPWWRTAPNPLALATYPELLADPGAAEELGRRARERVLDEHTYAHRARQILELVGLSVPVGVRG